MLWVPINNVVNLLNWLCGDLYEVKLKVTTTMVVNLLRLLHLCDLLNDDPKFAVFTQLN